MKKGILLAVLALVVSGGCRQFAIRNSTPSVVGAWQCEGGDSWKFIFAKGGAIPKIFRDDGLVMDTSVGGVTIGTPNDPIFANHVYGPCIWSYDSKPRILKAIVTIDDFYVKALDAELNCKVIDTFEGPLSEDGKTWTANWTTTTQWGDKAPDQVVKDRILVLHKTK